MFLELRKKIVLILAAVALVSFPCGAQASGHRSSAIGTSVSGGVTWSYAQFEAEETNRSNEAQNHFFQQYSLLVGHSRNIFSPRFGHIDLSLGGEWNILDAESNGADRDLSLFKPLYAARVHVAPMAMPFSLKAWVEDLQRSRPNYSGGTKFPEMGLSVRRRSSQIIDDISNGVYRQHGFTLLIGETSAAVAERYQGYMRAAPKLFVEYRETVRDNTKAFNKVKYRIRDLAFVSLNKRDNWLHYELQEHTDYLDPMNNEKSSRVLLGTVDLTNRRRWINLTNWLQLSADASFTVHDRVRNPAPRERAAVNLFMDGRRSGFEFSLWPSFYREHEVGEELTKAAEVPIFSRGEHGTDGRWRFNYRGDFFDEDQYTFGRLEERRMHHAGLQYDYQINRHDLLESSLEYGGGTDSEDGESLALRLREEWRRKSQRGSRLLGLSVAGFTSEAQAGSGVAEEYFEAVFEAAFDVRPRGSWRYGGRGEWGSGRGSYFPGPGMVKPLTVRGQTGDPGLYERRGGGDTDGVLASLYVEHDAGRLDNRLELTYDWKDEAGGEENAQYVLSHRLSYSTRVWNVSSSSTLTLGDHYSVAGEAGGDDLSFRRAESNFVNSSLVRYAPSPAYDVRGGFRYQQRAFKGGGSDSQWTLSESSIYRWRQRAGFKRVLFSLRQGVELQYVENYPEDGVMKFTWDLEAKYYPLAITSFGFSYNGLTRDDDDFFGHQARLDAELLFRMLTVALNYTYGTYDVDGGGGVVERNEHHWGVDLKKVF